MESFSTWSKKHIPNEGVDIFGLEDFVEVAMTSYHPVKGRYAEYTDTIRYTIPRQEKFTQENAEDFTIDLYDRASKHIDGNFEGMDLTIWKGPERLLVQALVFRSNTNIDQRSVNCDYDSTKDYDITNGDVYNCDIPNVQGEFEHRINFHLCHLGYTSVTCGPGSAYRFKLTPGNNSGSINVPCDDFFDCLTSTFSDYYDPEECESSPNPKYCNYLINLGDASFPYKLLWQDNPSSTNACLDGSFMENYQELYAEFVNDIRDNSEYGTTPTYDHFRTYLALGTSNGNRVHRAYAIYSYCVPSF